MKIKLGKLRKLIRESVLIESIVEVPYEELKSMIASMDPDEIATQDYIDTDSGEVFLEKGEPAKNSRLHPNYTPRRLPSYLMQSEPEMTLEDAVAEYVSNWEGSGIEPGEASDAAEGFFHAYPGWEDMADEAGQTRAEVKSMVADFISNVNESVDPAQGVLKERFGEPIGKTVATVGAADVGPCGKKLWDDEPLERQWADGEVVKESEERSFDEKYEAMRAAKKARGPHNQVPLLKKEQERIKHERYLAKNETCHCQACDFFRPSAKPHWRP
jgi:hypothetical protein